VLQRINGVVNSSVLNRQTSPEERNNGAESARMVLFRLVSLLRLIELGG
jgi:hypothetical protein